MNRDLYHPLTVGAIIIWVIMALSFSIPLLIYIPILSLFITLYFLYKTKFILYIFILLLCSFIGIFGNFRVKLSNSYSYIPIKANSNFIGDIKITKDVTPIKGGFLTSGEIFNIKNEQIKTRSSFPVTVFTRNELFQGYIFEDVTIKNSDLGYSVNIKDDPYKYKSKFYNIRTDIMKIMKSRSSSGLLVALITGNKAGLNRENIDLFRESGCSHILALSGFHVGILTLLIIACMRLFFSGIKTYIITIIILITYLVFVGVTPSLLRSVLMFITAIILKLIKVKLSLFMVLVLTFLITVILFPEEFSTLSFQLSYLALTGILTIGDEIKRLPFFVQLPSIVTMPLSASISAMVATSFICFPIFGVLYPIGVIASLVLSPLITVYMWLGLLSLVFVKIGFVIQFIEKIIYFLLEIFANTPVIDETLLISPIITLIPILIPVILLNIKLYRRMNAGRFNLKFKL